MRSSRVLLACLPLLVTGFAVVPVASATAAAGAARGSTSAAAPTGRAADDRRAATVPAAAATVRRERTHEGPAAKVASREAARVARTTVRHDLGHAVPPVLGRVAPSDPSGAPAPTATGTPAAAPQPPAATPAAPAASAPEATPSAALDPTPDAECGTLPASQTWSPSTAAVYHLTCPLVVPAGTTLTLAAGTVVKADPSARLQVQGTLRVLGTATSPVTLTSWQDDTVGGDSNDDGDASDPGRGDWGGIAASPAGGGAPSPTLAVASATVRYATTGLTSQGAAAVSVTRSTFSRLSGGGIAVRGTAAPTITGNTVSSTGGTAITVGGSTISLAKLGGNSGTGNALNGVALDDTTLSESGALPWAGTLGPVLTGSCTSLTVPPDVTLTLNAGAVVKARSCTRIEVQGSLVSAGTSTRGVTFTSWLDDSVGGDTDGSGDTDDPSRGDWSGIYASPAGGGRPNPTITMAMTTVRYAATGLDAQAPTVSVTDSTFTRLSGDGIVVRNTTGLPTITGNTVSSTGGTAITVSGSAIDLAKLDRNSGSGNLLNGVALASTQLATSGSLPWSGTLVPVLSGGCSSLEVPAGKVLTLGAGTVVKGRSCTSIDVQGTIATTGTAEAPVVLTSWRDDSAGGDTNGDGTSSVPARGDWEGIGVSAAGGGQPNPKVQVSGAAIRYGSRALDVVNATTSIADSTFSQLSGDAVVVRQASGVPVVVRNTVTSSGGTAITVASSSVDLAKLDGNSGSGNGLNGVALISDTLAVSGGLPWTGDLLPVLSGGCSSLTVPARTRLSLGAGTVVKARSCTGIDVRGTLVASGTSAAPVTLTSWRDDSVGGDTNGDGDASAPQRGDWEGVATQPAGGGLPNPVLTMTGTAMSYGSAAVDAPSTAVTITQSRFTRLLGDAINVRNATGVPTITGNTVTSTGGTAISVSNSSINLSKLNGNRGSGNALNGVALLSTTLATSGSLPWTGTLVPVLSGGCSSLAVPVGVTLTMNAGAVVKGRSCTNIRVSGSLVTAGSETAPVTLTSVRDDSVGGDTNGDGDASAPTRGDFGGIVTVPAGSGQPNPTVSISRTALRYGGYGLDAQSSTVSVTDSSFSRLTDDAVSVRGATAPTIARNTITSTGGTAITIVSSTLNLSRLDGNSGSGNAINGVALVATSLAANGSLPWTGNLVPVLSGGCSSLSVPAGLRLTLNAGSVVKGRSCTSLAVSGTLVANGTSANPVQLTSWRDDSAGGDTNGDRGRSTPEAGDWGGIRAVPAGGGQPNPTITLTQTSVRYATTGLDATTSTVTVTRSRFSQLTDDGVRVSDAVGVPTLTGNTVTAAAEAAIRVAGSSIDVAKLDGNSGSGNGLDGLALGNVTLAASGSLPWTGSLVPVLTGGCSTLTVPAGQTLTLGAGSVIKARSCTRIDVDGSIVATGTSSAPATITSIRDDAVAGDTDHDDLNPAAGDWGGIVVGAAGRAQLTGVLLRYAATALDVDPAGLAEIHGEVSRSLVGVSATSYVDATGVNWGDPSGPAPVGLGVPIRGFGVTVVPWVGWTAPERPRSVPRTASPPNDCRKVMFLAVRGSGEPPKDRDDDPAYANWQSGQGGQIPSIRQGFARRLAAKGYDIDTDGMGEDAKTIGLRYRAMHVPYFDDGSRIFDVSMGLGFNVAAYTYSIWQGVFRIQQYLADEIDDCEDQKYVLVGYSQGALSIHIYLNLLGRAGNTSTLSRIAAVGLLADPAKNRNGAEHVFTDDFAVAPDGSAMKKAIGIYAGLEGGGPLPSSIVGRTASMCHDNDIVCAPGWGSWISNHENYADAGTEMDQFGAWLADRMPDLPDTP